MITFDSFAIIIAAAFVHASLQLSVSVMTIMSGHALGKQTARRHVTGMMGAYTFGAVAMVTLLLSTLLYFIQDWIFNINSWLLAWNVATGLSLGIGIAIWVTYYQRRKAGTVLWVPRPIASFLTDRAKNTDRSIEAFSLGLTSVATEIIFAIAPLLIAGLVIISLPENLRILAVILYTLIASGPLIAVTMLVGGGKSLAHIQRWREKNKRFLQFAAGGGLIVLAIYCYVDIVKTILTLRGIQ